MRGAMTLAYSNATGTCHSCKRTTVVPTLLLAFPASFGVGTQKICPSCLHRKQRGLGRWNWPVAVILLAVVPVVYLVWPHIFRELQGFVAFYFFAVIGWPLVTLLHQALHALVGWALGMDVFWPGFPMRWRRLPMSAGIAMDPGAGALNWILPDAEHAQQWRATLVLSSAPAFHLACLIVICVIVPPPLRLRDWPWDSLAMSLSLINLGLLLISLLPVRMPTTRGNQHRWPAALARVAEERFSPSIAASTRGAGADRTPPQRRCRSGARLERALRQ